MKPPVNVGLIGSQFISAIHAEALKNCTHAHLAAVASPTPGNAGAFANLHPPTHVFTWVGGLMFIR